MNGGPWNDRWVNTTTVPKLREQLHLAYKSGIDRIWIINVGDLKPKEMPISFIMDYAWDPDGLEHDSENGWLNDWTKSVLGCLSAKDIKECARASLPTIPSIISGVNPRSKCLVCSTTMK